MEIKKVGVIGAGVMGVGVGQNLAQSGMEAVLVDVSDEVLEHAKAEIRKNLRFQGMFQKGTAAKRPPRRTPRPSSAASASPPRSTTSADVDFVVENVPEKWEIKSEIYPRIDAICPRAGRLRGQHLLLLDHPRRRPHQAAGPGDRHALHESGAPEADGRGDPRPPHQRGDDRDRPPVPAADGQRLHPGQRHARLRHQPGADADHQRGGLRPAGRRRHRRAGRPDLQDLLRPQDGPAGDRRPDRARHHPLLDRGALRELQRQQVPPLPAAQEDGRRRPATAARTARASTTTALSL